MHHEDKQMWDKILVFYIQVEDYKYTTSVVLIHCFNLLGVLCNTVVVFYLQVEDEKYSTGVTWLKELIIQIQFTADRISIIANRMTNDIAAFKRNGQMVTRTIIRDIIFSRGYYLIHFIY